MGPGYAFFMDKTSSPEQVRGSVTGTTGATPSGINYEGTGAIDILLQDHRKIKSLLVELNDASHESEQHHVLEQLKELLTIHNATEENFVYAALAKVAGKQHESEHLYHETAEADMLVFELDTCLKTGDLDGFKTNAKKLQAAILEHIDDEEQKAFPDLRQHAKPDQTEMLNRSVSKFRTSLHFAKP